MGLRVNPECSTQEGHAIYDPCAPFSRLGDYAWKSLRKRCQRKISPHWTGCISIHYASRIPTTWQRRLQAVEEKFGKYLHRMKWVNFGGGHHITRPGYDTELLKRCIRHMKETYGVEVYLEPGEASGAECRRAYNRSDGDRGERDGRSRSWTLPLRAICRTCWRCRTGRR